MSAYDEDTTQPDSVVGAFVWGLLFGAVAMVVALYMGGLI